MHELSSLTLNSTVLSAVPLYPSNNSFSIVIQYKGDEAIHEKSDQEEDENSGDENVIIESNTGQIGDEAIHEKSGRRRKLWR
jgi:hypothetical protein